MGPLVEPFWSIPEADLLRQLQTTAQGLTSPEAGQRLALAGPRSLKRRRHVHGVTLLVAQFTSPLILLLIAAAVLSLLLHDPTDAVIILTIVLASGVLGFWQERGAARALETLLATVGTKAAVFRDGTELSVPVEDVVAGDVVTLSAGASIPGDCRLLESHDVFVDEASLTGETYPVAKIAGTLPAAAGLHERTNTLFMGTHVVSGLARAVVVHTGSDTEFGKVSQRLTVAQPETEFERGIRQFGYLLMEVTLVLVGTIFAINVYFDRPVLDAFIFSLALAVGLTPQLLPVIITVNLAHGAKRMALQKVIVRRLSSIENVGSMNVLCADKTGTLTDGVVRVRSAVTVDGRDSDRVLLYAYLNAMLETGFVNPIDAAIRAHRQFDISAYAKVDEVPYDFVRKRLTILVSYRDTHLMFTKGALDTVLAACSTADTGAGTTVAIDAVRTQIQRQFGEFSAQGYRTLGVAYRDVGPVSHVTRDDEAAMTFAGCLVLFDPPKPGIVETIAHLTALGVSLKMITGDNRLVAAHVASQVGMSGATVVAGSDLAQMSDTALAARVSGVQVFAEIEPNQKERLILALQKAGHVVGYIGDGINDASALHAADVGISVEGAVDVAREAADIVLLERDLEVLVQGVQEGRATFANTVKYVFMATSANFGNMFSMAGASLFLPFLPLLPKQILLTNLMTDVPEMTIATDSVDREMVERPRRWDIGYIRRFMLIFGVLSSVFDYVAFAVLLLVLHATPAQFRTGWFIESVVSASLVVLVIRTRQPFFRSRPSRYLLAATLLVLAAAIGLPFSALGPILGFTPVGWSFLASMGIIVVLYVVSAEIAKRLFYRWAHSPSLVALLAAGLLACTPMQLAAQGGPPETLRVPTFGTITIYKPATPPAQVVLFFSGDGGWNLGVIPMADLLRKEGALVVGIDIRTFMRSLDAGPGCAYPAGVLEELSRAVQLRLKVPSYQRPILVGYSSGATMTYAALAGAPPETFAGGISLGFCPDLALHREPCHMRGLRPSKRIKGVGFDLAPDPALSVPWIVLHGDADQVCAPAAARAFVEATGEAEIAVLPRVGHGFGVPAHWQPQFLEAYRRLTRARVTPPPPTSIPEVAGLHLVEVPALAGTTSDAMAVMLTGDGGWAELDKSVAKGLAAAGIPVVGWSSLTYYWTARTPDQASSDLARIVERYSARWKRRRVLVIGYSFGADVAPFLVNRLPDALRDQVERVVLLGPSDSASFEFHVADWFGGADGARFPTAPELTRLAPTTLCVSAIDEPASVCRSVHGPRVQARTLGAGHHFGGQYDRLVDLILR